MIEALIAKRKVVKVVETNLLNAVKQHYTDRAYQVHLQNTTGCNSKVSIGPRIFLS